jgi:regulator of sirC expression with transglutaminase-like and TPR domain
MSVEKNDIELPALIRLIDEPDEKIYRQIRLQILAFGEDALTRLENARENSFDTFAQKRLAEIIRTIQTESLHQDIAQWVLTGAGELFNGALLISRFENPGLDVAGVSRSLARIIQDVWLEMNDQMSLLDKVKVVNHILFDVHRFAATKPGATAPEHYFIQDVLENKRGSSVGLGILYLIVAQSLKLPVFGVDLPFNFVLATLDKAPARNPDAYLNAPVMFYINPVYKGMVFVRREIDRFLKESKIEINPAYYQACNNVTVIQRMVLELRSICEREGQTEKMDGFDDILGLLR